MESKHKYYDIQRINFILLNYNFTKGDSDYF